MKSISLLSLVALVAIGCSEVPSAPSTDAAVLATQHSANAVAFRPPPPADFIADASAEYSAIGGTYFLNGPGNNGWISFNSQQPAGTSLSSPSARITFHQGVISGQGTLTLSSRFADGNSLVIDLKTGLSGAKLFGTCTSSCGSFDATGTVYRGTINTKVQQTVNVNLYTPGRIGGGDGYFVTTGG